MADDATRGDLPVIEGEATEIREAAPEPPRTGAPAPAPIAKSFGYAAAGLSGAVVGIAVALGAAWYFDPRATPMRELAAQSSGLADGLAKQAAAAKALEARLAAIEAGQAGLAKAAALEALDKRVAKLESAAVKPDALAAAQADARAARDDAAKALALASAEKPAAAAPAPAAAAAPDPRIGKLETAETALGDRVAKIEAALSAPKTETRAPASEVAPKADVAGQAIAALALEQRLRAGEPFAAEWAALSRLGADPAALSALKPFAELGAPNATSLAASFEKVAPGILASTAPTPGDGVLDRLYGHMSQLVTVRAVGEVAGESPSAVVSQIEAALARGQVAAALSAYAKLPEPARKAAGDWATTAEARGTADAAARALREGAIQRLAAAKS
jgi:hypothetical protein